MDYDLTDIRAVYDRGRDHAPEFLDLWMQAIEGIERRKVGTRCEFAV